MKAAWALRICAAALPPASSNVGAGATVTGGGVGVARVVGGGGVGVAIACVTGGGAGACWPFQASQATTPTATSAKAIATQGSTLGLAAGWGRGGTRGTGGAVTTRVAPGRIVPTGPESATVRPPTRVGAIVPLRGPRRPRSTVAPAPPPSGVNVIPGASVIGIGAWVGASRSTSASSTFWRGRGRGVGLQPLAQVHRELVGRLVALVDVLGERLLQDRHQGVVVGALRDQVEVRLLVGDLVEDRHEVVGVEGPPPGRELEEHAADAEQVAAPVHLRALHLLGGHVVRGSHDVPGAGHGGGGQARHPEVHDLHRPVFLDEDVGGLDVAVDDAGLVGVGEPGQHLHDHRHLPLDGHRRGLAHRLLEVLALQELHRDEGRAVGVAAEVEDGDQVRVLHLRDRPGLASEALLELGVVRDLGDHDLEGHVAVEDGVVGEVDLAHGALAEGAQDLVLADPAGQVLEDRLVRVVRLNHPLASGRTNPLQTGD